MLKMMRWLALALTIPSFLLSESHGFVVVYKSNWFGIGNNNDKQASTSPSKQDGDMLLQQLNLTSSIEPKTFAVASPSAVPNLLFASIPVSCKLPVLFFVNQNAVWFSLCTGFLISFPKYKNIDGRLCFDQGRELWRKGIPWTLSIKTTRNIPFFLWVIPNNLPKAPNCQIVSRICSQSLSMTKKDIHRVDWYEKPAVVCR